MTNELLKPKYNLITFYCYNFGKYDAYYILSLFYSYNNTINKDEKKLKVITLFNYIYKFCKVLS